MLTTTAITFLLKNGTKSHQLTSRLNLTPTKTNIQEVNNNNSQQNPDKLQCNKATNSPHNNTSPHNKSNQKHITHNFKTMIMIDLNNSLRN